MNEGEANVNGQILIRKTSEPSPNFRGQRVWVLECGECAFRYGVNGCDAHERLCPRHQGGKDGFDLIGP